MICYSHVNKQLTECPITEKCTTISQVICGDDFAYYFDPVNQHIYSAGYAKLRMQDPLQKVIPHWINQTPEHLSIEFAP